MSATPNTASVFRRRLRVQWTPSIANVQRSARMSALASSAYSDAMRGYTALYTAYVTAVRCCIPEYTVDLQHLIELLINDKRNNPSNYSLVILSEGAEWQGYAGKEYGETDPFGHRKKMSVAEDLSDEIKRATGEETVVSDLTYDLRSGSPDFVDRLVAF